MYIILGQKIFKENSEERNYNILYANSTTPSLSLLHLQRSFFCRLTGDKKSEKFFKVFYERMKLAQQEIKATVTVNTSDLGSKRKDEDNNDKDAQARKKGRGYHP